MHIQESGEMYLETIFVLSQKKSSVRAIDVSEQMGFSKPSVSRAVGLLKDAELLNVDEHGSLLLTEKGLDIAEVLEENDRRAEKIGNLKQMKTVDRNT